MSARSGDVKVGGSWRFTIIIATVCLLFIATVVNLKEVPDPKTDPNPNPNPPM